MKELQPIYHQLQLGNHKQNILLWIIHSNQLRNMHFLLLRKMDDFRIIFHNKYMWNILDGNVFQLRLSNRPKQNVLDWLLRIKNVNKTNLDFNVTLVAIWCNEFFKAEFAIKSSFFFNKSDVLEWTSAGTICASEMIRAPDFTKCGNKWSSLKFKE